MSTVWPIGIDGRRQWGTGTRETEVRLDGWCESGLRQQRKAVEAARECAKGLKEWRALVHI